MNQLQTMTYNDYVVCND